MQKSRVNKRVISTNELEMEQRSGTIVTLQQEMARM
jgi:hypothetical protein